MERKVKDTLYDSAADRLLLAFKLQCCPSLIRVIKHLCDKATTAVFFNGSIGDWFRTTVGVRQGCLLSPTLYNIFLESVLTDAFKDHEGTVSTGGRAITNLRFADDIDGYEPWK